jgi:hypothetical protein
MRGGKRGYDTITDVYETALNEMRLWDHKGSLKERMRGYRAPKNLEENRNAKWRALNTVIQRQAVCVASLK